MSGFKDLEIYQEAYGLAIKIHRASLKLPQFELYEQGSQIRRSSKRIKDTIAEGYGRKRYKMEFIKFLTYSLGSCDETLSHLDMISELYPDIKDFKNMDHNYTTLGKRINSFIQYVENSWK